MTAAVYSFRPDGSLMNLADPQLSDVCWQSIAKALSTIARFNGINPVGAYPVAQHCVMGADALHNETGDPILAGIFLLHDAHEAWIGDQTRPAMLLLADALQRLHDIPAPWLKSAVETMKTRLDYPIYSKAGLPNHIPQVVHDMDTRMLRAETRALFGETAYRNLSGPEMPAPKLTGAIKPWGAMKAEEKWLDRLERYLGVDWRAAA